MDALSMVTCVIFLAIIVVIYLCYKKSITGDRPVYNDETKLRTEAEVVHVNSEVVGLKGEKKYRTVVTFDDGFKFISHDTIREDHYLSYNISITESMKDTIIKKAIAAHNCALREHGLEVPQKPFVCGKCGHKGPYDGNCPECGSSLRRFNI